jgi:hypothetical protein
MKPEEREAAAVAAGWRPHRYNLSDNARVRWMYPQLHLRVWAECDGVHLLAYTQVANEHRKLVHEDIARAVWQPSSVTEWDVVDWGRRALTRWLSEHSEALLEEELSAPE